VKSKDRALIAFMRINPDDIVMVIHNLGDKAARDYALTLPEGSLAGNYVASLLSAEEAQLPILAANDSGGFDSYQPLPEIPGGGTLIIKLIPAE